MYGGGQTAEPSDTPASSSLEWLAAGDGGAQADHIARVRRAQDIIGGQQRDIRLLRQAWEKEVAVRMQLAAELQQAQGFVDQRKKQLNNMACLLEQNMSREQMLQMMEVELRPEGSSSSSQNNNNNNYNNTNNYNNNNNSAPPSFLPLPAFYANPRSSEVSWGEAQPSYEVQGAPLPESRSSRGPSNSQGRFTNPTNAQAANDALQLPPDVPTVGSRNHTRGNCKPCINAFSQSGCSFGKACVFCHLDHTKRMKDRPPKVIRQECKDIAQEVFDSTASNQVQAGPEQLVQRRQDLMNAGPEAARYASSVLRALQRQNHGSI